MSGYCLAGKLNFGLGVGSDSANGVLFALMCCAVGAVGVIWLCWFRLKLARVITSIVAQLKEKNPVGINTSGNSSIAKLSKAVKEHLENNASYTGKLEQQTKDMQIQIQLLQKQKKNTEAIVYSIRDAVIVVDEFDKLIMANASAGRILKFDFKNSRHKPIKEVFDTDSSEFADFLRQCRQSKIQATRRELEFQDNEKLRTFECIVSCVYDQQQQICGTVAVMHDVTHEKEVAQMKNDFVNHVSHYTGIRPKVV